MAWSWRTGGGLQGLLAQEVLDDLDGPALEVPLAPGTRLGRFEVRCFLGAGSVGRVYRAQDPTLGREVAIKALAEAFREDAVALRRFEREARVLATVSHPNVAAIHGLEVIDGAPYLVLELVEGDTLEERLARGPMAPAEAVDVARQIAEALEEAHRKGVVHRDLKPSNVKLTGPGRVKVLDFGLARAVPPGAGGSVHAVQHTLTATRPGTVQGTAPYMSPEQARGASADARSDVWAFGCVLYEMLAGRRAFSGATVADVLASVMRDEVDWTALPDGVPPALRRLMERCLRRDLRQRLQHIGDARLELAEMARFPAKRPRAASSIRWARRGVPWLLAAAAVLMGSTRTPPPVPARTLHLPLPMPPGVELAEDFAAPFAISPDASTLAFLGRENEGPRRLYVRPLGELSARPLAGTEGAWQPFFSPDGKWIAFFADLKLKKVALAGGAPVAIAEVGAKPRGGWWGSDGTIVLSKSLTSGLSRVSADGGRLEDLTRIDFTRQERSHRWPQVLPGARAVIFTVESEDGTFEDAAIEALSLRTGERRPLVKGGAHARFLAPDRLVYASEGRLFAVGFDPDRLEVKGTPRPVLEGVRFGDATGGTHMALADDGTLVYVPAAPISRERHLAWMDLQGRRTHLPGPPRRFRELRLDPRGERAALRIGPPDQADVWIQDTATGKLSQLTFGLRAWHPVWTPDGKYLTVGSESGGRWRLLSVPLAGGAPRVLYEGPNRLYPGEWSPDGRFLAFQERHPVRDWDIAVLEVCGECESLGRPRAIATTPALEARPRFSPDGRWLAYESDELDAVLGVYVVPFGRPGPRANASRPAGRWPVWGAQGELFYWVPFPSEMRRVTFREEGGAFQVRTDDAVWAPPGRDGARLPAPVYDFDPATRRFLYLDAPPPDTPAPPYQPALFVGWGETARGLH